MLRSSQISRQLTLVHWLKENSIYHPNLPVMFSFQSKVTFADETQWGNHILDLNLSLPSCAPRGVISQLPVAKLSSRKTAFTVLEITVANFS